MRSNTKQCNFYSGRCDEECQCDSDYYYQQEPPPPQPTIEVDGFLESEIEPRKALVAENERLVEALRAIELEASQTELPGLTFSPTLKDPWATLTTIREIAQTILGSREERT